MRAINTAVLGFLGVLALGFGVAHAGKNRGAPKPGDPPTVHEALKRLRAMSPAYFAIRPVALAVAKPKGGLARSPLHKWSTHVVRRIKRCLFMFEKRVSRSVTGRVAVSVEVQPGGKASKAKFRREITTRTDATFNRCVEQVFEKVKYPKGGTAQFIIDLNNRGFDLEEQKNKLKLINNDDIKVSPTYGVVVGARAAMLGLARCYKQPPVGAVMPACSFCLTMKLDRSAAVVDASMTKPTCKELDQHCVCRAARRWSWTTDGTHKPKHEIPFTLHFRRR
jgi:hypothetical protein